MLKRQTELCPTEEKLRLRMAEKERSLHPTDTTFLGKLEGKYVRGCGNRLQIEYFGTNTRPTYQGHLLGL